MTTAAQSNANRANAQKSTGPRTAEGKAKVAHNALKHGLLAKDAVVTREDLEAFELFRTELRAELAPVGMVEALLAERIVGLFWRLQRAERFHTGAFDFLYAQSAADPQSKRWQPVGASQEGDVVLGITVVKDFSQTKVLERLLGYERRFESSLYRSMAELHKLVLLRHAGGANAEAAADSASSPGILPVDVGHGWDAPATAPDGVRTNVAETQEPVCETKPIPGSAGADQVPGAVTTNTPEAQENACGTKPIGDEVSSLTCKGSSEESHTATPAVSHATRPTSDAASAGPASPATSHFPPATAAQPPACETKPISERRIRDGEGYRPIFRRRR